MLPPRSLYPHTYAAFEAMDALEHLERIDLLDRAWEKMRRGETLPQNEFPHRIASGDRPLPSAQNASSYDLIYAGGGLGLIHAAVMARRYGQRVLLFDKGEVGCAHREWNISRLELAALVQCGFCTWAELGDVIMTEYERGVVRFFAGQGQAPVELWMPDVLNVALDANALLRLARRKLEAAGGTVLDHRAFRSVAVSTGRVPQVLVEVEGRAGSEYYSGRLLLDGMGSASPLALQRFAGKPFAGVCPTVGTVAAGFAEGEAFNEHNPQIGDILVTVADAERGQQYMWEGFPGRGDELTVYLFYYDTLGTSAPSPDHSGEKRANGVFSKGFPSCSPNLLELFEEYFKLLPAYKNPGPHFRHLKPVYGYIPARHSLARQEAPLLPGVLPIGDSAAQQSPLTFCGFGSHIRNLDRTTRLLAAALRDRLIGPEHIQAISPYQANVSLNWVFSRFMQPWGTSNGVNLLQNHFLAILNELGVDLAQRFFRDRMRWGDYHPMILGMFRRYPAIVGIAWRVLGADGIRQWVADYLRFCGAALQASAAERLGAGGRAALANAVARFRPALGFALLARFAEWEAMGWVTTNDELRVTS